MSKDSFLRIGTWNIRGLNGKEEELINEFENSKLEVLAITETKKKGKGCIGVKGGHMMMCSGVEHNIRGQSGVGCIIKKECSRNVLEWEAISDRILKISYETDTKQNFTILITYAPNEGSKPEETEKFWEMLQLQTENKKGSLIVLGDLNGRVGNRPDLTENCVGRHGEDSINRNGKRIIDFCIINDMVVGNTLFEHKEIHKFTREDQSRKERSIVELVMVERTERRNLKDVRVKRGYDVGSDHFLV